MREYAQIFAWLLIAVGAAMSLGTGAAVLQHRRTGTIPGQPGQNPYDAPVRAPLHRLFLGILVVVAGVAALLLIPGGSH
jgi:hypothetical protein